MFKASYDPKTEKGTTQLLLAKRNKRIATIFKQVKDPVSVLKFFSAIRKVYVKYFGDEERSALWLTVLIYLKDHGFFWQSDLKDKFGFTPSEADSVLKRMGKRNLINVDKGRKLYLYNLSPDGHLFLRNFSKDCASAMAGVVKVVSKRPTKKKVFTTKKIKKPTKN